MNLLGQLAITIAVIYAAAELVIAMAGKSAFLLFNLYITKNSDRIRF